MAMNETNRWQPFVAQTVKCDWSAGGKKKEETEKVVVGVKATDGQKRIEDACAIER
jgi:hypothetical protein